MNYQRFYNYVIMEKERLLHQNTVGDFRLCKALAACYELQDYLAGRIAETITPMNEYADAEED